jgi:hypothetical protein
LPKGSAVIAIWRFEALLDDTGVKRAIEAIEQRLPWGVRPRQLKVRTLLLGMLLAEADHRPAHLSRVHNALLGLGAEERWRLGIFVDSRKGPHLLTYRQVEYTARLVHSVLATDEPDGAGSALLECLEGALLESSVPQWAKKLSSSLAVDWSDIESFSKPPPKKGGDCADPEASWGRRHGKGPGQKDELFFGYYFSLATMVNDENKDAVPELVRAMALSSCREDPVPSFVSVLARLCASSVPIGDVLADSGYAHRRAESFALPMRALGASLVMDLHPNDRGPQGTFAGAVLHNGNLYCPATPRALFALGPLARDASLALVEAHDKMTAELSCYKLGRICGDDADGYHRVACPAVMAKCRCPLRKDSMELSFDRPEVVCAPEPAPKCCLQKSITVPPSVNAKTAQKHDYPSKAHRRSYARRTAVERSNSRVKDPASIDVSKGWCRLMGLVPISLFLACALVVRNLAVSDAFIERALDEQRRKATGLAPRKRTRRRRSLGDLAGLTANLCS